MSALAREHGPTERRLRRREYDHLVDLGVLDGERLELFRGRLIAMSPQKPRHAYCVQGLTRLFYAAVGDRCILRCQLPLIAADDSEPEPDLALVPPGNYAEEHPDRAWLVVEVSDSSLQYDRIDKGPLYAESGVTAYWLVNLVDDVVEVYTEPVDGRYRSLRTLDRTAELRLPAPLDDLALALSDILG